MLTSRITATSNAIFTVENMFVWNVLPPCAATVAAISFVALVSLPMAGVLFAVGGVVVLVMFRLAAAGRPLHHDFADRAAAVRKVDEWRVVGHLIADHHDLRIREIHHRVATRMAAAE